MNRSELPDNVFGIPKERKYPMPDKKHTESAIKLFNHVDPKYEEQLAKAIIKNMKKYDIDPSIIGNKNRLKKYIKSTNESVIADDIDTIIFDIGDVLVDCTSFDKAMKERNIPEQYIPILKEAWLSTEDEQIEFEDHILRAQEKLESAYLCRFMTDVAMASIETVIPFDFTDRMLHKLKERYKLYYLSNWGRGSFEELKKTWRFDFLKYFDGGVVSYEVKTTKPDPAIYKILLEKYNIDPHRSIFFDDKKENVQVARNLGMNGVVYNRLIGDALLLTGEVSITESTISEYDILTEIIEFNNKLNNFEYILPNNGNIVTHISYEDYCNYYRYLSSSEFEKYTGGICWDYVAYEANWFSRKAIKYNTYFIYFDNKQMSSHTVLLFYHNNSCYWFESSWKKYAGIYKFKDTDAALTYIISTMRRANPNIKKCHVVPYNARDKKLIGIDMESFYDYIMKKKPISFKRDIAKPEIINIVSVPNNESAISEYGTTNGTIVGIGNADSVYIVNYTQNNVLSGKPESKFGICKTGMKDLHIKGGKYDKVHYVSDIEEFTSQAKDIKMYRYKKKIDNFYETVEDAVTDDDFYKGITGRTIPEKELIAFDKDFELEECFVDTLHSIRECVEAQAASLIEDLHVIPILTEQCIGRVYNYYRDINGVFAMNELTHIRSKSYESIEDIPSSTMSIIKQGYLY